MNILLIGAPGSGKGTQAEKLKAEMNLQHLSTGNLFRENFKKNTPLGQTARIYMDKGELVPDEVTNEMVRDFVKNTSAEKGLVFDGFPRNLFQAETLDQILKEANRELNHVIFLDVPDDIIVERLTGRLWAQKSGCIYHIKYNPPKKTGFCDESGEVLITRRDDREDVLRSRLDVFRKETLILLDYYEKKDCLSKIHATGSPEKVFSQILKIFK